MAHDEQRPYAEFGYTQIWPDMKLRHMVVHNPKPKGYVLFLHGFPETVYVWKDIAQTLGKDYEVHAIDWPGYGLSTRPDTKQFSYAPKDYAAVLKKYIHKSGIDSSNLVIYATDIGALPALLLAIDEPRVAKYIVVGDFAPFNRPDYMYASLQSLKSLPGAESTRAYMNKTRDEILANAYRRGLSQDEQFDISEEIQQDMSNGWSQGSMSSADAFFHYYQHFTRDQDYLESNIDKLKTHVRVIWGEKDIYINKQMGVEFAQKIGSQLTVLPGIGHYPHLQDPAKTVEEVCSEFNK
ncbi:alpha/beta fold hydrolase [Nitrosomonas sp. Nm34]|uniref:alpha/beta fold hydrolase n=1 Tax=Nitrosomonas sp. Nm34 TaxID=1881055 RepID=UPI0008E57139|nr:alpha/beta hydrolase [Nitrosomonas sp. Nm34]SFI90202.1 Pimeloyl-ACP methyl ester carboxylesterase [Nitrosomonas sp. Nm34]